MDEWIFVNPEEALSRLVQEEASLHPVIALLRNNEVIYLSNGFQDEKNLDEIHSISSFFKPVLNNNVDILGKK